MGHVNDPTAVTDLSSLQLLIAHILHQDSRVCNSEHNEYYFCDFVHLCVLELFTAIDLSECKLLVKSVHANGKALFRTLVFGLEKNNRKYKTRTNMNWGVLH